MIKLFNKSEFISVLKESTMYIQDVDGNNIAIDIENYSRLIDNILAQKGKSVSVESFINEPFKPTPNSLILGNKILKQYFRNNYKIPEIEDFTNAFKMMIDSIDIELATKYLSYDQVAVFKLLKEGKYSISIEKRRYDISQSKYDNITCDQIYNVLLYDLIEGELQLTDLINPNFQVLEEYDFKLSLGDGTFYNNKILNVNFGSNRTRGVICKRYMPSTMLTLYSNKNYIAGGYIVDEQYNHSTGVFNLTHSNLINSTIDIKCIREANNHYSGGKYCIKIQDLKLSDIPTLWYDSVSNNDLTYEGSHTIKCVELLFGTLGWASGELYAQVMSKTQQFNIKFQM